MASYIANNPTRDTIAVMLTNSEAKALLDLAEAGLRNGSDLKGQRMMAAERAMDALAASTNTMARRAGFYDPTN